MARPRLENPRRARVASYLTNDEKKMLDRMRGELYPRMTESDALREIILEWCGRAGKKKTSGSSTPPDLAPGETLDGEKDPITGKPIYRAITRRAIAQKSVKGVRPSP